MLSEQCKIHIEILQEHAGKIAVLEEQSKVQLVMLEQQQATLKNICTTLTDISNGIKDVIEIMQTARGLKSIVVWISPFVVLVASIIGIVKYFL